MVSEVGSETTLAYSIFTYNLPTPIYAQVVGLADGNFEVNWGDTEALFTSTSTVISSTAIDAGGSLAQAQLSNGDFITAFVQTLPGLAGTTSQIAYNSTVALQWSSPLVGPVADVLSGVAVSNGNNLAVSYYDTSASQTAVKLLIDGITTADSNIYTIAASGANNQIPTQAVQLAGGNYVVEWTAVGSDLLHNQILTLVSPTGTVLAQESATNINGTVELTPASNGNLAFTFSLQGQIYFGIDNGQNLNTIQNSIISPAGDTNDYAPAVATLANGDFVDVWYNSNSHQIEGQLLDPTGVEIGSTFQVSTNPISALTNISVSALTNGNFVVVWSVENAQVASLKSQVFSLAPSPTTVQQEILGLYAALYNRAADFAGYSPWVSIDGQQSDSGGVTVANANTTAVTLNDAGVLGQAFVNTQSTFFQCNLWRVQRQPVHKCALR